VDVVKRSRDRSQEEEQRVVVDKEGVQNIIEYNFAGIRSSKQSSSIVIGLTPIVVLEKTNLAWLKSNTWIG
jgi:hypothetical protein